MQQVTGLTAIAGVQTLVEENSQASAAERLGNSANPRHADDGGRVQPTANYSKLTQAGSHGPYGLDNQLLGDFDDFVLTPGGFETDDPYMDRTPSKRAGPWPKGIASGSVPGVGPDDIAFQLAQSAAIHGIRTNAATRSEFTPMGDIQNDQWEEIWDVEPGTTLLQPASRQAMSSGFMWGTRDRTQSFARQNEYGFDSGHHHRRIATGPIPGNFMWMQPSGRPLRKSMAGPARPAIGADSPFAGQDLGQTFSIDGSILQNVPTEYIPPSQPNLAASVPADNDSVVEWY